MVSQEQLKTTPSYMAFKLVFVLLPENNYTAFPNIKLLLTYKENNAQD